MTFGEKLKKHRTDAQLTQNELAEKLYVTRTAISKWESDRGYPNIDSLKAIAKFFSVTVDELLSSDEVLTITEEDSKQKERSLCASVYALLDLGISILLFLPFFGESDPGTIQSVSLITLTGVEPYLKTVYLAVVIGTIFTGILTLAFGNFQTASWQKSKTTVSLVLGTLAVLVFTISSQPYAAIFSFVLLAIKALLLIKRR